MRQAGVNREGELKWIDGERRREGGFEGFDRTLLLFCSPC
jgi:hypothetical protein